MSIENAALWEDVRRQFAAQLKEATEKAFAEGHKQGFEAGIGVKHDERERQRKPNWLREALERAKNRYRVYDVV